MTVTEGTIEEFADLDAADQLRRTAERVLAECRKVIVGQNDVLEQLLIALLARGHCLLVGVPGLAKTLMIRTLAEAMELTFNRIQFTPDLMPSDVTGTEILQDDPVSGTRGFQFFRGPLFSNVLLADEINRTPPKTQSALLEAMAERQVTVSGTRHTLPDPFFVLATQNPIEQEGTYPLPEAQLDRFMFNVLVDYPSEDEEYLIVEATTKPKKALIERVVSGPELLEMQQLVLKVPAAPHVIRYAMQLARATRKNSETPGSELIREYVTWGAGPRASQYLILAGKARALLHGRTYVSTDDIKKVALPVLRHRILTNFNAEADGITSDNIVEKLLQAIPTSSGG
ncbi:MAG: MoxR family ATPase [Zavarzinella sp.]